MKSHASGQPIGVLAVQGAVSEHAAMLAQLGHPTVLVKKPEHLANLAGLIIPGGESTAIARLAAPFGLLPDVRKRIEQGTLSVLGTCAGLILLARDVVDPGALAGFDTIGGLDVSVARNAYGNQLDSFEAHIDLPTAHNSSTRPLVAFIRAPRITSVGEDVEVIARHNGEPVAVQAPGIIGATFHPEITGDLWLHSLFVSSLPAS